MLIMLREAPLSGIDGVLQLCAIPVAGGPMAPGPANVRLGIIEDMVPDAVVVSFVHLISATPLLSAAFPPKAIEVFGVVYEPLTGICPGSKT